MQAKHSKLGCGLGAVLLGAWVVCQAQQPGNDVPGAQVLTRGPVHEAFAGIVTFNPQPGVAVTRVPPALIEEMPPDEKPEGDNVTRHLPPRTARNRRARDSAGHEDVGNRRRTTKNQRRKKHHDENIIVKESANLKRRSRLSPAPEML